VSISGSGPAGSYTFSRITGSHGEARAVVPEPSAALLFAAGILAVARQHSVRRGGRSSA
jgi:hypothetical protein